MMLYVAFYDMMQELLKTQKTLERKLFHLKPNNKGQSKTITV